MAQHNLNGAWGESVAAKYLLEKGFKLLACGYHCRYGEIDLIASNNRYLAFVEVKTRKSGNFAMAREHVDVFKQNRIRTSASMYLSENPTKLQPRFDVIEIYAPQGMKTEKPKITHMEGAFE